MKLITFQDDENITKLLRAHNLDHVLEAYREGIDLIESGETVEELRDQLNEALDEASTSESVADNLKEQIDWLTVDRELLLKECKALILVLTELKAKGLSSVESALKTAEETVSNVEDVVNPTYY